MSKTLTDITAQLEEPFAIQDIDLLPKSQVERDGKTFCMALPYADPRVYQDRLNKVAPGEWSTPPPIALAVGQKIVVYVTVTICGISHTDVGEASATSENAATESYAQAFKRACAQFGLGRYLYSLEKAWVPYNKQRKQIDLDAAGIQEVVRKMYAKARVASRQPTTPTTPINAPAEQTSTPQPAPASQQTTPPADVKATEQQIASIKKMCQHVSMSVPDDLEAMSFEDAKKLLSQMTTEYKAQRQPERPAQTTPAPSNVPLKDPRLAMLERSKRSIEELGIHWEDAKRDAGHRGIKDGDLSVAQIASINKLIPEYKQRMGSKKAS